MAGRLYLNRPLDFASVRAVGFDLDHTLAVYDDDRINSLACEETLRRLVQQGGFPEELLAVSYDGRATARGLVIDLENPAVLKLDGDRRVRRARVAGEWIAAPEIERRYKGHPVPAERTHPIHSPFDLPTAFLFDVTSAALRRRGVAFTARELCLQVRAALDHTHTRGALKNKVMAEVGTFVRPLPRAGSIAMLRDRGYRLFVLTNSGGQYATALLDYLFPDGGPSWRELFDVVVADARKPAYFHDAPPGAGPQPDTGPMVEGGHVGELESTLTVAPDAILYLGDHAAADIDPPGARGWRTIHVVPEVGASRHSDTDSYWGNALTENGHDTWFSRLVSASADGVLAHVDHLLAEDSTFATP